MTMRRFLPFLPTVVLLTIAVLTFLKVREYAVDVPFWDEWEFLFGPGRLKGVGLDWLLAQHNEHRIVLTKALTALSYAADGWNTRHQILLNYLLYACQVGWLWLFCSRAAPEVDGRVWPAFLIFLFAPSLHENLLWGFQSQFHFAWFFAFLSIFLVFQADVPPQRLAFAVLSAIAAIFSFSGGLVMAVVVTGVHAVYRVVRGILLPTQRRREAATLLAFTVPVALALTFWFHGFAQPGNHPALILPFNPKFWTYFGDIIAWGFGVETRAFRLGWFLMLATAFPLLSSLRQDRWTAPSTWMVGAAVLAVWGFLGSITMGRAALNSPDGAKISRYAEVAGLLVPLLAASWAIYFRDQPGRRVAVFLALWLFALLTYRNDWAYDRLFSPSRALRTEGLACAERFYQGTGNGSCPTIYPFPIDDRLKLAKELGVSFTSTTAK